MEQQLPLYQSPQTISLLLTPHVPSIVIRLPVASVIEAVVRLDGMPSVGSPIAGLVEADNMEEGKSVGGLDVNVQLATHPKPQ